MTRRTEICVCGHIKECHDFATQSCRGKTARDNERCYCRGWNPMTQTPLWDSLKGWQRVVK